MNSAFRERVQGFLNSRSVPHSVECAENRGVTPASSSSQFSIGVTSTAAVGPKLDPPSLTFQLAAPPSSTIAAGFFSPDCAKAFPKERHKHAINTHLVLLRINLAVCWAHRLNHWVCQRYNSEKSAFSAQDGTTTGPQSESDIASLTAGFP